MKLKLLKKHKQDNQDLTGFKIFTENDLPSKDEMDKNLDNFKMERDKI